MKDIYRKAREKYKPKRVKVLFIAESPPPPNGKPRYFYFEQVHQHDNLFVAMVRALYGADVVSLGRNSNTKIELLKRFKKDGYFLIDAVEFPLGGSPSDRKRMILKHVDQLIARLKRICHRDIKIILIKANIYRLLAGELKKKGFNILNTKPLPFPMYQHKSSFTDNLKKLLE